MRAGSRSSRTARSGRFAPRRPRPAGPRTGSTGSSPKTGSGPRWRGFCPDPLQRARHGKLTRRHPTRRTDREGEAPVFNEFIQFLRKTNALALAVAVIIGGAIGKVVTSVVNDLLMPVLGLWLGGGDWRTWQIVLKAAPDGKVLSAIGVGSFLGALVDFVIIAF